MTSLPHPSLLLMLGFFSSGCSAVVDAGRVQCSTDSDCTRRGAAFASTMCIDSECQATDSWSCAKHATLTAKSSAKVASEFTLMDAITQKPIVNAAATLCGKLDIQCTSPMAQTQPDSSGTVRVETPPSFDGYVDVKADGYDSTMVFLPPSIESTNLGPINMTSMLATQGLAAQLGKPVLAGKGRVLTNIAGCDMQSAGGVALAGENMGDQAVGFYSVGGLPSFTATSTDDSGFAGFFNVEPGSITLNAQLETGGRVGRVAMVVRPDYVSVRRIQPWTD
jgi:hypothetical protein